MFGWFGSTKTNDVDQSTLPEEIAQITSERDAQLAKLKIALAGEAEATVHLDELQRHVKRMDIEVSAQIQELQARVEKAETALLEFEAEEKKRTEAGQKVAQELEEERARCAEQAGQYIELQRHFESLNELVASQSEELRRQVDALEAEREEVQRLEKQIQVSEALRNASVTITASVGHFQPGTSEDQASSHEQERDASFQEVEPISELEVARMNSHNSGSPRFSFWGGENSRGPRGNGREAGHSASDSEVDVATKVDEVQAHLQALLVERDTMQAELATERQKGALWDQARKQNEEALQMELVAARSQAKQAMAQEAAAMKELAISNRKRELLSQRLVDMTTRIDSPRSGLRISEGTISNSLKLDTNTAVDSVVSGSEAMESARAAANAIENTRGKVGSMKAKWESMRREAQEGQSQLREASKKLTTLEEEKDALTKELCQMRLSEQKHRNSLTEIASKLDFAETSWNPWKEINDCKALAGDMKLIVGRAGSDALQGA